MTTTTKVLIGVGSAVAVGGLVYMYVNKKGMFKVAEVVAPIVPPATATANADGSAPRGNVGQRRYPPHIYVKGKGYTDWQGKLI